MNYLNALTDAIQAKATPTENGCIIWNGASTKSGYGVIAVRGDLLYVHKIAWQLANKKDFHKDKYIRHSCGNRLCINSQHLYESDRDSPIPILERLLSNSVKDSESGCLLWQRHLSETGYGRIWWKGKRIRVHRVAWELANGRPVAEGMIICHRCNRSNCINAEHLYEGTALDNARDAVLNGSYRIGSAHHKSKLTELDVLEIVRLNHSGINKAKIACQFSVSHKTIRLILNVITWSHVTGIVANEQHKI